MAFVIDDRVRESSTTTGTGPFTTAGAPGGYQTFGSVMSVGDTTWYAIVQPGSNWETGIGTYTGTNTLARTTVISSNNSGAAVNFGVGSKDVFITQPAKKAAAFPAGTLMLFQQTSAPIYWTKQTTHNDKALRVTSGTAGAGGANSFLSSFQANVATSSTTITQSAMAGHSHPVTGSLFGGNAAGGSGSGANDTVTQHASLGTAAVGGDNSHGHPSHHDPLYRPHIVVQNSLFAVTVPFDGDACPIHIHNDAVVVFVILPADVIAGFQGSGLWAGH
jgi:hypothetical protein